MPSNVSRFRYDEPALAGPLSVKLGIDRLGNVARLTAAEAGEGAMATRCLSSTPPS